MLSVFITPWMKPDEHPPGDQRRLRGDDRLGTARGTGCPRPRPPGGGGRSRGRRAGAAGRRRRWRAAYWNLPTRRWLLATRASTAPGSTVSRCTVAPGRDDGERAGRGDAERVHRLADDVLAQHRADRGEAVAAARERRPARSPSGAGRAVRPSASMSSPSSSARPSPSRGRVAAELVAGVGLRDRRRAVGHGGADQQAEPSGLRSQSGSRPSSAASGSLSASSSRVRRLLGLPRERELGELAGEAVVEGDGRRRGVAHALDDTRRRVTPGRVRPARHRRSRGPSGTTLWGMLILAILASASLPAASPS